VNDAKILHKDSQNKPLCTKSP